LSASGGITNTQASTASINNVATGASSTSRYFASAPTTGTGYLLFTDTTLASNRGYVGYTFATDALDIATAGVVRGAFSSTGLAVTGAGSFTGNLSVVKNGAYLFLDGTNSDAEIYWKTNGANRWALGMNAGDGTENWNLYNYTTASINLSVNKTTGFVGIGTASPNKLLEVNKNLATNTVGSGEVLRLIGDDGNNVSRVTEIGFGTGPTGGVYSPVLIGAVVTSASGYNTKDLYFATRSGTADSVATERMRITSTGNVITSAGSAISYGAGTTYIVWTDEPEYSITDSSADSNYKTMKTFVASKSGSFNFKFSGYIQSGTYYWAWRLLKNSVTVASSGNYGSGLDTGQVAEVHAYRRFAGTVSSVTPGDIFELQMVSSDGSGNPSTGNGQLLYAKEFRIYSTTPSLDHGGSTNVFGNQVGIGTTSPAKKLHVSGDILVDNSTSSTIFLSNDYYKYITVAPSTGDYLAICQNPFASGIQFGKSTNAAPSTFVPLMTIAVNGNVGIGTASPAQTLSVTGTFSNTTNAELATSAGGNFVKIGSATAIGSGTGLLEITFNNAYYGQRVKTSNSGGGSVLQILKSTGAEVGLISHNDTVTTYGGTSDYRLKDITGPLTDSGTFIDALKPKVGTWKSNGSKFVGFIAHEFAEVSPSSVQGEKDAVDAEGNPKYQGMQASSAEVIANLVAELQSVRARLAALESK
jgi:hypothetical protein